MAKALTQKSIEVLRPNDKRREIPDGQLPGLFLILQPSGARSWAYRYRVAGKTRKWTLGSYPKKISLAEARALAKKGLAQDDPAASKKAARRAAQAPVDEGIFDIALTRFISQYEKGRRRASTITQGTRLLKKELLPALKGRALADIKRRDIRALVDKIETRKTWHVACEGGGKHFRGECVFARAGKTRAPRARAVKHSNTKEGFKNGNRFQKNGAE